MKKLLQLLDKFTAMSFVIDESLKVKIENLPDLPGVYIFKDAGGKVIYVGKAKSIRKRVNSHFSRVIDGKQELMLGSVADIDYIVTANEIEALLLEYNLIKKERPYFNVLYKDDKSYPYLAITLRDEWPRLFLTRNLNIEGARYFGPYPRVSAAREVLNSLLKIFPLRTCKGEKPGKKGNTPCLMYHINKCPAPCIGKAEHDVYIENVKRILDFLTGRDDSLVEEFEKKMFEAAGNLEFEKAAAYREKMLAARYVISTQRVIAEKEINADIFGLYSSEFEEVVYIRIIQVRKGRVIGTYGYAIETENTSDALFKSMLLFYSGSEVIPEVIVLPEEISTEKKIEIEELLCIRSKKRIEVRFPKRGIYRELLKFARENAIQGYYRYRFQAKSGLERTQKAFEELKDKLGLKRIPLRIECYDMSGFRDENPAGVMVVFEDGKPLKKAYRRFKVSQGARSDYEKMLEVLKRRFKKAGNGKDSSFSKIPDLIVVDGGKAQLSAARKALQSIDNDSIISSVDIIAIAKPDNIVYVPDKKEPVRLPEDSESLKILIRVRDEAHRFAVGYFRKLEEKRIKASVLDTIKGIGPSRRKKLINYFGSVEKIARASLKELTKVVPHDVAVRLKEELNK